jgi:ADP-heptose:LPS heptosyltransferase
VPYVTAPAGIVSEWAVRLEEQLGARGRARVGLVWSGNPSHKNDANRSLALERVVESLIGQPVDLVSLQKEVREADRAVLARHPQIRDFGAELRDFADTAGLIAHLDVVISVDTSVAHLAGAMGKPLWVLLPYVPDWRWLLDREDSPWYPTARLFRQPGMGDWASVLRDVAAALRDFGSAAKG